jgi:multicomponent Na+:H+ antiporter subunit C
MTVEQVLGLYNYWIVIFLMMTGFYIVIARNNLVKTVIGLNIFQISVILLYVTIGKVSGGTAPIVPPALVSHGHAEVAHSDHGHDEHHAADHSDESHDHGEDDHGEDDHGYGSHEAHGSHKGEGSHDDHHDSVVGDSHESATHDDGHAGDVKATDVVYSNPLPSVLMLTAIVVGIATTALALALIVRIREDYGTIEEDEILELDRAA